MKVIFLQHVLHVAKPGEVKEVSSGYAVNFLFPKKLAKPFTDREAEVQKAQTQKKESARRMLLGEKETIIQTLEGEVFKFTLKSQGNKALGSIKPQDIASYIDKKYHIPLQKKHIVFLENTGAFKTFGDHHIYIDLGNNFACKAKVCISREM